MNETLYIVTVISNPMRFKSRPRLYKKFIEHLKDTKGIEIITVEHALHGHDFEVTEAGNPNHIQLRGGPEQVIWLKESMMNVGFKHLPDDWQYAAWVDADIRFLSPTWVEDTIEALQTYKIVQPWEKVLDLGPKYELIGTASSFGLCYHHHLPKYGNEYCRPIHDPCHLGRPNRVESQKLYHGYWHPGYAWAMRRDAWDGLNEANDGRGGFIDWAVLGSGDNHMAFSFIGNVEPSMLKDTVGITNGGYYEYAHKYEAACKKVIRGEVGYVKGEIAHFWHGAKQNRGYLSRWGILIDTNFDPSLDIEHDENGLIRFTDHNLALQQGAARYFASRREDD